MRKMHNYILHLLQDKATNFIYSYDREEFYEFLAIIDTEFRNEYNHEGKMPENITEYCNFYEHDFIKGLSDKEYKEAFNHYKQKALDCLTGTIERMNDLYKCPAPAILAKDKQYDLLRLENARLETFFKTKEPHDPNRKHLRLYDFLSGDINEKACLYTLDGVTLPTGLEKEIKQLFARD